MKICIDARVLEKQMTGIGRYLLDLLDYLPFYDRQNKYFLISSTPLKNINTEFYTNIVLSKLNIDSKIFSPLWLNFVMYKYIQKSGFDVFFSPNNLCPLFKLKGVKYIITIHDVFHKTKDFYSFFYRKYLDLFLPLSINTTDKIITISNYSKNEISSYYPVAKDKLSVIYQIANKKFISLKRDQIPFDALKEKYNLPEKYILYVGAIENRKNINGILKINDLIQQKNKDLKTVLVGKAGFGFEKIHNEIKKREKNVFYLKYVDEKELNYIYNQATFFLFPSYFEGFGLPLLEAMQCGLPVLSSCTSSIPEIVGKSGILHNPNDYISFAGSILELLADSDKYAEYKRKALENAQKFTAEKFVKAHIDLFNF